MISCLVLLFLCHSFNLYSLLSFQYIPHEFPEVECKNCNNASSIVTNKCSSKLLINLLEDKDYVWVRAHAKRFCCPHLYGDFFFGYLYSWILFIIQFFQIFRLYHWVFLLFHKFAFPLSWYCTYVKRICWSCIALKSNLVIF